ncbi:Disease resistance protein RGA2 [Rhynchospora pubera]|uniref:Disease resistance protein RGA2 n=1 Tax=Rhynchospora pubera TaxID=906938 RepID=A0AAV8BSG3_9POAL|nr:Disease resistance protein RGA2 [Rhynchospora pubera]
MGGVGKTTLAQMIYKNVKIYFDYPIWIWVSDKFDIENLTRQLIESATGKECNLTNLNKIQEILENILKSKRVLLVLDDIWSKDWQDLLGPMNEVSEGSAIILTTRLPEVFQCSGSNMTILDSILLEGLEHNIYWDFFKRCTGLDVGHDNYLELEYIASEICSRLKGSPLAAKTLGGLLRKKIDKQHWITIRDSKMWELEHKEHDIMPVLQLSYQYLPSHLKKCFSFCSLFPKDHEFTDIELAKFWIMEGFIPKQEKLKDMEDLALSYFHDLKNSCFFHYKRSYANKSDKYVIHDLMHDICQSITRDECYCLENEDFGKISLNIHHISIFMKKLKPENLKKMHKYKKLHSLVASPNCEVGSIKSWCDELTSIRRISLSQCKITDIPENIGNLKHLHYLDISGTKIQNLPDSFCNLYNLQHLDMSDCDNFSESSGFLDGSNKLTGLEFFRPPLHVVPFLSRMPNLLRTMQLYDLTYKVGNMGRNRIENLKHLTGVRGFLDIRGLENVSSKKAAEEAELNKQEYLKTLRLFWQDGFLPLSNSEIHKEVLEGLCPDPKKNEGSFSYSNLEVFEIFNYNGPNLPPSWMGKDDLSMLRRVKFEECSNKTVSQLPCSITELAIFNCQRLESLVDCLQPNLLPNLKCIEIGSSQTLRSLPVESFCEFVSLEKLVICNCKMLTCPRKMTLPPSIKVLELNDCGELEYSIPSCLHNLTSLEVLSLSNCPCIISIPDEVTRNLKSLRCLWINSCPNLQSIGDKEFLQSVEHCSIEGRKFTWGRSPDGRQLSDAPRAAAPSSSHSTIPSEPQNLLFETPSTDIPSSSNVRKRKAHARK